VTQDEERVPTESSFPPIIVGAWQLSTGHHRKSLGFQEAMMALDNVVDLFEGQAQVAFDCADIYTGVEDILGKLRSQLRARWGAPALGRLRVHTKLVPDRSELADLNRGYITRIVDRSLSRLGTDRLDLVQFAWWDYEVPGYKECLFWLDGLRREGKVERIGLTNFDAVRLREILDTGVPIAAHQVQYSALDHRPEGGMAPLCVERGVALLCYGTLAGGLLSDRWLGAPDPAPDGLEAAKRLDSRSQTKYRLIIEEYGGWEAYQDLLALMNEIAKRRGATIPQVAVAYALSRPAVSSVILGMTQPERFAETMAGATLELSPGDLGRIHGLAQRAPGPSGPVFGLERDSGGPHAAIMKYDLNQGRETVG